MRRIVDALKALFVSTTAEPAIPEPAAKPRAKTGAERAKELRDRRAAVGLTSRGTPPKRGAMCNGPAVMRNVTHNGVRNGPPPEQAPPSILDLESSRDDGGDAREAPSFNSQELAERTAQAIEGIINEHGHWPKGGWVHAVTVEQVEKRLRQGANPTLIVDAVRAASARAPNGPISTFQYFNKPGGAIDKAIAEASVEPPLPLPPVGVPGNPSTDWRVRKDAWHAAKAKLRAAV